MSPVLLALLGLLAYKALKGRSQAPAETGSDYTPPPGQAPSGQDGGSLGDLLGGILGGRGTGPGTGGGGSLGDLLGGMLGGGAPTGGRGAGPNAGGGLGDLLGPAAGGAFGGMLGEGLRNLVRDMQANGHAREAQSWVGTGPNEDISENDLANAIGADDIDRVAEQTGMPRDQLLSELRQYLPGAVDQMTPRGQLPSEEETAQWV
ncbi:MAG: YidB family protein [Xanthobacteraceae bacterium]